MSMCYVMPLLAFKIVLFDVHIVVKTNWQWFSMVCPHSGQNLF